MYAESVENTLKFERDKAFFENPFIKIITKSLKNKLRYITILLVVAIN